MVAHPIDRAAIRRSPRAHKAPGRGLVLPVLLLLLALMGWLATSLWRSAITRESLAHADADRLQARQAARTLIREAQQDIQASTPDTRHSPGPEGSTQAFYPRDMTRWREVATRLQRQPGLSCLQGICMPLPLVEPTVSTWVSRLSAAASPGQFVPRPSSSGADIAFSQLYPDAAGYWVELLPFDSESVGASASVDVTPGEPPLIYRITAYVQGRLPGTRVVQQVLWLSNTASSTRAQAPRVLQWREWLE